MTRGQNKRRRRISASRSIAWSAVLALALAISIESVVALSLSEPTLGVATVVPTAAERWSPANERVWIGYHVGMLEGMSFREQHLNQEVLAVLLMNNASELPSVRPCGLKVQFLDSFGEFAIGVDHPNPARRLDCLRGAVDYLLQQPISETDFLATRKDEAHWERMGFSSQIYAQQLALRTIYQKYSPLHQIHSVTEKELSDASFEEFDVWLRRSREQKLISFGGKAKLLESLDLPVPDPMVLRLAPLLKSPRVPAGVLFLESEPVQVPALIMVSIEAGVSDPVDRKIADRLSCNSTGPPRPAASPAGSAISHVFCQVSDWYGDVWLSLGVGKVDGASDQDFCRQVQELTGNADIAAVVRGSPEGSKGLYVLLPPACETLQ